MANHTPSKHIRPLRTRRSDAVIEQLEGALSGAITLKPKAGWTQQLDIFAPGTEIKPNSIIILDGEQITVNYCRDGNLRGFSPGSLAPFSASFFKNPETGETVVFYPVPEGRPEKDYSQEPLEGRSTHSERESRGK